MHPSSQHHPRRSIHNEENRQNCLECLPHRGPWGTKESYRTPPTCGLLLKMWTRKSEDLEPRTQIPWQVMFGEYPWKIEESGVMTDDWTSLQGWDVRKKNTHHFAHHLFNHENVGEHPSHKLIKKDVHIRKSCPLPPKVKGDSLNLHNFKRTMVHKEMAWSCEKNGDWTCLKRPY